MKADLHTHSTASDGQYTPTELAQLVKKRGTEAWALTDHDNLDGLHEAAEAGEALGTAGNSWCGAECGRLFESAHFRLRLFCAQAADVGG